MKIWVFVLSISASGILAGQAGAQTTAPTNIPFASPSQGTMGVPSTPATATNSFSGSSFQNRIGSQVATTTNFTFALPAQTNLGVPSMIATNLSFGRAFHNNIGSQTATTTNFNIAGVPESNLGAPPTPATNPFFGNAFHSNVGSQIATTTNLFPTSPTQSEIGVPSATATNPFFATTNSLATGRSVTGAITNFLFVSSTQSWIGQGQSLFAAPTNGYDIRLSQISPNILQFSITATNSAATNWLLEFSITNDFFGVGVASNAVSAGGSPARLVFGGMGRGDNTSDGAFNVLEATYSSNQIVSFAADFVQFDNNDTNSWTEGSIRYNSTIPDTVNLKMAPVDVSFQKGNTILTWSTNLVGFQLEYSTNLPVRTWFTNSAVPTIVNGQYTVTVTNGVSAGTGTRLYRLMKPL